MMPPDTEFEVFNISQHSRPDLLRANLQTAINAADGLYDPILLGYGLCSHSVVGLSARKSRLVVFRADDCIAIFLGSQRARLERAFEQPGSYYLSRGWMGDNAESIFDEYTQWEQRYGTERAKNVMEKMLAHYHHLVHIVMPGTRTLAAEREYARGNASKFGLEYVEIPGTAELIRRMGEQAEDPDILVFLPGQPITLAAILEDVDR